jgi:hypothetical protein
MQQLGMAEGIGSGPALDRSELVTPPGQDPGA